MDYALAATAGVAAVTFAFWVLFDRWRKRRSMWQVRGQYQDPLAHMRPRHDNPKEWQ